jgi:DNA-binding MarR family transcriptional regulator
MNAGELIILGRQLTRIGTAALRDARLPGGAIPTGISLVGADVLAHPATSVSEIAQRTGLRPAYVSESVTELRDRGVVETEPDPGDEGRTRVRLAADARPERATTAALADVTSALRDALGPETRPDTLTAALAALTEINRRLSPGASGSAPAGPGLATAAPDQPAGDAEDEEETEETLITRAVPTRSARSDADPREPGEPDAHGDGDDPDEGEPDVTQVDSTRVDRTRVDLSRTRVDATRADRTRVDLPPPDPTRADWKRADLPRPASSGGAGAGNTANARRAVRAKADPAVRSRSGRKRQSRLSRIARYLTGGE